MRQLPLTVTGVAMAATLVLWTFGTGCNQDPAQNTEAARHALAAYLTAWRTLDFKTMYAITTEAARKGKTLERYEADANKTLLENAILGSHMTYAVGDATRAEDGSVQVSLQWTVPDMAAALREVTALSMGGTVAREMLDAVASRVKDGTIPLASHTRMVTLRFEEGRWRVDPAALYLSSHWEKATTP